MMTLTSEAAYKAINDLQREKITRVYSGKPGCGCGCKGKYTDNDGTNNAQITRVLNVMKKRADEVEVQEDSEEMIFALEDGTRFRWIFVKK